MQNLVRMTNARYEFGLLGERIAARWMMKEGWRLLEHRYRDGHRDIDLIMQRHDEIAFVEVKARRAGTFGSPLEAVHERKQRELVKAARSWIRSVSHFGHNYRFDVIGVLVTGQNVRIRHVEHAFQCPYVAIRG